MKERVSSDRPLTKTNFVQNVFSEVPATYELVNHVLTLGLDIVWRRRAAGMAARFRGREWVDVCTGTGEMGRCLTRVAKPGTRIRAVDFSSSMIAEAQKKRNEGIQFVLADIKALPFADESIDLITMAFAARNVNVSREALVASATELHRVLRRGGTFINLETSQPPIPSVRRLFRWYVRLLVRRVGSRISGSRIGYAYLSRTIPRFYSADELADLLQQAGFGKVVYKRLLFGVAAIHTAKKEGAGTTGSGRGTLLGCWPCPRRTSAVVASTSVSCVVCPLRPILHDRQRAPVCRRCAGM